jgi:uncharacterized protein
MVFVGGPRQVGKTTFCTSYLEPPNEQSPNYFSWDDALDQQAILTAKLPKIEGLIVFDEIHKFAKWRQFVKGFYDKNKSTQKIIVTGSARLDHYRKGGDSLMGRYHYYRLHPFSLNEISKNPTKSDLEALMKYGGFPEPFFKQDETFHRRWQRERVKKVVEEDLRDLDRVKEVTLISLMVNHLTDCVGSPLSINQQSKLLQVAHATAKSWIEILEALYLVFRVSPYGSPKIRAVKKEQKLYFWDFTQVSDAGARFENLVASHLLKYCHFIEDTLGHDMELRYLRDTDGRETDFVVLRDHQPEFAVECKVSDRILDKNLKYFKKKIEEIPMWYQVHLGEKDYLDQDIRVLPFPAFCKEVGLV